MPKINVFIKRLQGDDQGTIGTMSIPAFDWRCFVNELPDRNNEKCYGRIPEGEYDVNMVQSLKYGEVYLVKNVPDRSAILIHNGNYAGDTKKKWLSDVLGCIELGCKVVILNGQRAVINSRSTRDTFQKLMNGENFKLIIQ